MFTSKNTETRALCRSGLDLAVIWHLLAHFLVSRSCCAPFLHPFSVVVHPSALSRWAAAPQDAVLEGGDSPDTTSATPGVFFWVGWGKGARRVSDVRLPPPRHSTAPTMSTFDPEVPSPGEEAPPGEPNCSTGTLTASPWEALGPTVGHYAPAPRPDVYTSFPGYPRDLTGGPGLVYGGACEASGLRNGLPPNVRP